MSPIAFDLSHGYQFGQTHIATGKLPTTGAYATTLANENVTWEKSEQINLGIDAVFLGNRLRVSADWYNKKTKDWLVQAPGLSTAGTQAPLHQWWRREQQGCGTLPRLERPCG